MFNLSKKNAFGIDISDLSVKIAKLEKTGGSLVLTSYGREEIPPGIIKNGEIKNGDALVQVIGKAIEGVKGLSLRTLYCVVSLPETESFIRVIQMPKMKESELGEALKWEIENHIPLSSDEVYFDWQLIEDKANVDFSNVLVGALKKSLADSYLAVLKKAGLRPAVFEIESIATARALVENENSPNPIMIIDLGAKRSSFIIFSGQAVHFTSSLPLSNESLIDIIAQKLAVDKIKARDLKFRVGLDREKEEGRVFNAMLPGLVELIDQIKKYNDFYITHRLPGSQQKSLSKIILCGGGANLFGLAEFLEKELKMPVEIGNPWINILSKDPKRIPEISFDQSVGYATALGLALRGADFNKEK